MLPLIDRFEIMKERLEELNVWMTSPDALSNIKVFGEKSAEWKRLNEAVSLYEQYSHLQNQIEEANELRTSNDTDMVALAEQEIASLTIRAVQIEQELKKFLIPYDIRDERNVIVEIRAGAGGEEAALFAADLYRMYCMYADDHGYTVDLLFSSPTELGGYREIDFMINGQGVFSRLKYESGVHRVQRVPETESQGRIQTSTVTVAILPEIDTVEFHIDPRDVKMESCKSSGAGGQHINKTESAVRLTHLPTGLVVECQEQRSQLKNREKAMKMLETRLYRMMQEQQDTEIARERKTQVGTGERCERIRTYNFPQGRVTDHRIGLTLYQLDAFLNGKIDGMIDALVNDDIEKKLKGSGMS